MRVVFVAGPYRAEAEWQVLANIRKAEAVAIRLWQLGVSVHCPHKNTAHFGGAAPDSVWLEGALEMVRRSDAVCCTDDWEDSAGARGEVQLARAIGIPVFMGVNEVQTWLESQVQVEGLSGTANG